jgi:hypothetical protein
MGRSNWALANVRGKTHDAPTGSLPPWTTSERGGSSAFAIAAYLLSRADRIGGLGAASRSRGFAR